LKTIDQVIDRGKKVGLILIVESLESSGYVLRFGDFSLPCLTLDQAYEGVSVIKSRQEMIDSLVPFLTHYKSYFLIKGIHTEIKVRTQTLLDSIREESIVKISALIEEALQEV